MAYTPEQIAQIAKELGIEPEQQEQNAPEQPQHQPVKLNVGGLEFTGNSVEEVQRQINVYMENARKQAAAQQVQTQVQQNREQESEKSQPEGDDPEWVNEFIKKPKTVLQRDTKAAIEAQMRELYGGADNWKELHRGVVATAAQYQLEKHHQQFFSRNGDYEATPENAQALEQVSRQYGIPLNNLWGLEKAWDEAKKLNLAKPKQQQAAPAKAPLPMVPTGGATPGPSFEELFFNTSDPAKQAELLRKFEATQRQ